MLDPRRLAVLREFAARGTIAGAADALAFTPSAVSQQLSQLQREAGVELLRKVGRRLELTDAGRTLVARADELLARLEEIDAELAAQAEGVAGTVRVGAFQTAASAIVIPALDRLAERHPGLRVELVESEAEQSLPALERGRLDVAIAEEYEHAPRPHSARLRREYLEPDEMVLALPHGHAAAAKSERAVPLASLHAIEWVAASPDTAFGDMFARVCRAVGGFEPRIRHRVNEMALLLDVVAAGAAALVPALGHPERDGRVAVRRIAEGPVARALFVAIRQSDRARPSTAAVVTAIRGQ